jgi:putative ABC transport system permease protein
VRPTTEPSEIIGVVPDFTIDAVHKDVPPIVYFIQPERLYVMYMRVDGSRMPEALEGIDKAWKQHGLPRPISRFFMDRNVAAFYADITQQGQLLTTFAAVAVFISVLGLFGMCVAIAERRVKEIGIRKAMGATRGEVVRMLVWQFTQPVLWANLIAWPVAFLVMRRWLEGFANHVDLELWVFAAATAAAGLVAVITVTLHAFFAAGTRPADALRYE